MYDNTSKIDQDKLLRLWAYQMMMPKKITTNTSNTSGLDKNRYPALLAGNTGTQQQQPGLNLDALMQLYKLKMASQKQQPQTLQTQPQTVANTSTSANNDLLSQLWNYINPNSNSLVR